MVEARCRRRRDGGWSGIRWQLQVVPASAQQAVKANDAEIEDRIAKRIADAQMDGADISVELKDGVARLTGKVNRQTDRLRALTIARSTAGVRSVVDEIQVHVQ